MQRPLDTELPVDVYWGQDQATVETAPMLLTEEQIAAALHELRDRLTLLELAIVGIEAKEEAPVELPDSLEYRD